MSRMPSLPLSSASGTVVRTAIPERGYVGQILYYDSTSTVIYSYLYLILLVESLIYVVSQALRSII